MMRPRTFVRKVVRRLQGMVLWEQRLNAWEAARFDERRGIDTAGLLEPTERRGPRELGVVGARDT